MHEQLCFPLGARQVHLPDIDLVGIIFYGRNLALEDALQPDITRFLKSVSQLRLGANRSPSAWYSSIIA